MTTHDSCVFIDAFLVGIMQYTLVTCDTFPHDPIVTDQLKINRPWRILLIGTVIEHMI